ncbi:hypothetical protein HF086_008324 [Spodoptera exigua]|uniref:Zinc finger PHD-type domain-containing protein n=1 Tax=Spodoptera exigua TaxID=7107 RepID=A0A922M3R5_SPOEX|nr:hypothetical protein HF086_008324 [Spodoptera exigua]
MSFCAKCNGEVPDGVLCSQCSALLHFGCSGLSETTYRKMTSEKRDNWRCIGCRHTNSQNVPNLADVLKELKEFRSDFDAMKSDVSGMKLTIQELATHWKDVNTRLEVMEGRLESMELVASQISVLQEDLGVANNTIKELRNINTQLKKDNDDRDQYARLNNLEISGVPFHKGENLDSDFNVTYADWYYDADSSSMVMRVNNNSLVQLTADFAKKKENFIQGGNAMEIL